MSRWLRCLLQPAHHDPPAMQMLEHKACLSDMTATALAELRDKLFETDDQSLSQYTRALWK